MASGAYGADDFRSKVMDAPGGKRLSAQIDPDKSIYGIPFGTTEEDFIAKHGKPMGYLRLNGTETAMLYGRSHAFTFESGKLVGIRIRQSILDWKLASNIAVLSPFDGNWRLSNGIENEMRLTDVKKILGNKLSREDFSRHYYLTDKARVELDFTYSMDMGDKSDKGDKFDNDDGYRVSGIFVRAK